MALPDANRKSHRGPATRCRRRRVTAPRRRPKSTGSAESPGRPRETDGERYPTHTLALGESVRLEGCSREPVKVVTERRHEIPLGEHRSTVVDSGAGQKAGRATGDEDAFVVRGPVLDATEASSPAQTAPNGALEAEHECGGPNRSDVRGGPVLVSMELSGRECRLDVAPIAMRSDR